tara:strand:- start:732 stop:1676 length:945 start_codon:yes stop_codon:yes gene_type:complete
MNNILLTGAAGYIGSVVAAELRSRDHFIVGVDRNGTFDTCNENYSHFNYDNDYEIQELMVNYDIDTVVHIGATSLVGPSVKDPATYYHNNVAGTMKLLDACKAQGVKKFVFASSAATYGDQGAGTLAETNTETPSNPYGWSKRMTEIMLQDYHRAYGIDSIALRFFNVAGAGFGYGQTKGATHLIARIMENPEIKVFGSDYDTDDGTCVRDYVHVKDVARAHTLAVDCLNKSSVCERVNIGSGSGYSVLDIINTVNEQTDINAIYTITEARAGDPAILVADISKAKELLNWEPTYGLDKIIYSAYSWYKETETA